MSLLRALCAMTILASGACRSGQARPPATPAVPATGAPLAQHAFHFGYADLSGSVEASGPPRYTMRDRIAMVEIPAGALGRILCAVYDRTLDVGGTLSGLGDLLEGEADLSAFEIVSITVVRETPFLAIRALFRHRSTPERVAAGGYADQEVSTFILNRPRPVTLDFVTTQLSDIQGRLVGWR